jgi:hypothetical protein
VLILLSLDRRHFLLGEAATLATAVMPRSGWQLASISVLGAVPGMEAAALHPSVFDPAYYLRQHPNLGSVEAAKNYWLTTGIGIGDKASSIFHSMEYLAQYPDLARAFGINGYAAAIRHYVDHGRRVGRSGLTAASQFYVDRPYSDSIAPLSGGLPSARAWVESFTDTEGNLVTVTIQSPPLPAGPQEMYSRAVRPNESPDEYFPAVVAEARKAGAKKIVVPRGVYEFKPNVHGSSGPAHWSMNGLTDIEIDGSGSELHFTEPRSGIVLNSPKRVALKNFIIDWPTLRIASLGRIEVGADGKKILRLNEALLPGQITELRAISEYDSRRDAWAIKPEYDWSVSSQSQLRLDEDRWTYHAGGFQGFRAGTPVIARHVISGFAIGVGGGSDVSLENIKVYAGPGMGFFFTGGRGGIRVANCLIDRRDSSRFGKRVISTALDAVHISNITGDVLIENNRFAYQGDDGFNLHTNLKQLVGLAANQITVPDTGTLTVGDPLLFFNSGFGYLGTAKATRIAEAAGNLLINIDRPPGGLNTESFVANGNGVCSRYILRHNQFVNNRARAR